MNKDAIETEAFDIVERWHRGTRTQTRLHPEDRVKLVEALAEALSGAHQLSEVGAILAVVHADDPLPGLKRYEGVPVIVAVRMALAERFKAACHWQQSAWRAGEELREIWDLAGRLAADHEAVPSRMEATCCQAHQIQARMLRQEEARS